LTVRTRSSYAIFDLTYTPLLLSHNREAVVSKEGMIKFADAAFSHSGDGEERS
jgi:hypothetical protein